MDNSGCGCCQCQSLVGPNPPLHGGAEMPLGTFGPLAPLPTSGHEAFEWDTFNQPQSRTITLNDGIRKAVLDLSGDEITYSGDLPVGESAKRFCNAVFGELQPKTCGTCRWYENDDPCKACNCPKMIYDGWSKVDEDGMNIEVGLWGIHPGPDFGCIHHRAKT